MTTMPFSRHAPSRRRFVTALAATVGAAHVPGVFAQGSELLFAINEGVSYRFNRVEAQDR